MVHKYLWYSHSLEKEFLKILLVSVCFESDSSHRIRCVEFSTCGVSVWSTLDFDIRDAQFVCVCGVSVCMHKAAHIAPAHVYRDIPQIRV